mgnify:CR=1 FL=1
MCFEDIAEAEALVLFLEGPEAGYLTGGRHVEVVVETVGDGRSDAELRLGVDLLHGLREHVRWNSEVTSARWDDETSTWQVEVRTGQEVYTLTADAVITAVGITPGRRWTRAIRMRWSRRWR